MRAAIGKTNEWYTPLPYIHAVREVLGEIDLDPASCVLANEVVRATRFYSKEENGLLQRWSGRCFVNPPYGRTATKESLLKLFVGKLLQEYRAGVTTEAILLIPVNTATGWFVPLWQFPICFLRKRIRFYSKHGLSDGASFPTCFVYLGRNDQYFIDVFRKFGPLASGVASFQQQCEQLELFL